MQLIGQPKLNEFVDNLTLENCPHFIILKGSRRCGKTTATNMIADKLNVIRSEFSPAVENVRHIISTIYDIKEPCIYWCEDLDKMSVAAKNSLLKVTEETPKNAYIVLHCVNNPLATLNSRSQVFNFETYKFQDYVDYCKLKKLEMPANSDILIKSCDSLAEFEYQVLTGKFQETYELACKVLDYIGTVSTVNAFKILSKLSLKKDAEGIEPVFFLTVLLNEFICRKGEVDYGDIIVKYSQNALSQLGNVSFSKSGIMERWLLQILKGIDEKELSNVN